MKIIPEIIFQAKTNKRPSGAFRLWFLAKDYDQGGSGFIPARDFRRYLRSLGIPRQTYYRWLARAYALGLIEDQGRVYRLAAWEYGVIAAGIEDPDNLLSRMVNIPVDQFVNKGWLSYVWKGFAKHFEGQIITRATKEKITGVPARTQRAYEIKAAVKSKSNYADMGDPSKNPKNAIAIDKKRGIYGKNGRTRRRLGNSYKRINGVLLVSNTKAVKERLRRLTEQEGSQNRQIQRLYCKNEKQTKTAIAQSRKWEDPKTRTDFVYRHVMQANPNTAVWVGVAL